MSPFPNPGHDGHGSVRVLYDASAAVLQLYTYSAYGQMLGIHDGQGAFLAAEESAALTILLYSGEPYYQQIAMQYLRARWYDSAVGRFNRLDDFGGNLRDPQSLHKYLYVHGDAVNGIDPSGLVFTAISNFVSFAAFRAIQIGVPYLPAIQTATVVSAYAAMTGLIGLILEDAGIIPDTPIPDIAFVAGTVMFELGLTLMGLLGCDLASALGEQGITLFPNR